MVILVVGIQSKFLNLKSKDPGPHIKGIGRGLLVWWKWG